MNVSSLLPPPLRNIYQYSRKRLKNFQEHLALARVLQKEPRKIIIGAAGTVLPGWVSTEQDFLNLISESDWAKYFEPDSIEAILAEHVWEHLTTVEAIAAVKTCYRYLKPGGYLRAAVPDGFHPDPQYIDWVRVDGEGPGADDHKVLYTYNTFRNVFSSVGFEVHLYEYFDEDGRFHYNEWDPEDGMIRRSKRFDKRNSVASLAYTSIILDATKLSALLPRKAF